MSFDPEWIHSLETVTPDDIRKTIADAIAAGGDAAELNAALARMIAAAGTIEELAQRWTLTNRLAMLRPLLHRETRKAKGQPPK